MHRPKRIVTTDAAIYDAVLAELSDIDETVAATHAYNVIARVKDEPKKASDITGFPEDDDIESDLIEEMQNEFYEEFVVKRKRKIPGMPGKLA